MLNPYCQVDFVSKMWTCPFCLNRNPFPPHYAAHISEANLPAELFPQCQTLEYQLPGRMAGPPAFLYIVDACVPSDELEALKDSISQSLSLLPPTALVGLITYGNMVQVHELASSDVPRSYVFKGTKDYEPAAVAALLGLGPSAAAGPGPGAPGAAAAGGAGGPAGGNRFLLPISECSAVVDSILEDLQRDPWPTAADERPARCTGVALSIASSLVDKAIGKQGARMLLFAGGPPTVGPGAVASRKLAETMRSHTDLAKGNAPLNKDAAAFYKGIAARLVGSGHCVDYFGCSLDQTGLLETKPVITSTGGLCVLADDFKQSVFKESFRRVFRRWADTAHATDAGHLMMGFGASLEVITSREYKVSGAIGPCVSLKRPGPAVSEKEEIGESGTCSWSLGCLDPDSTIALYFDIANGPGGGASAMPGRRHHLQLITYYQHSSGRYRMRVTTTAGAWSTGLETGLPSLAAGFDQECAAVMMTRIAVYRAEAEHTADVMRWLDRSLIRLCSKFAEYRKDDPSSFRLGAGFALFPQFMFHLRRSQFMQIANSSPDESAYHRMVITREDVTNSLVMIQPSLISYSFSAPPQPVLLDATSVHGDTILLLDTFFHVLIFHGEIVATWREQGYAEMPEHEAFRNLLKQPREDAAVIMESRFPVPRYIVCDQHKSQARFLMARLNPSVTHNSNDVTGTAPIFTDDVSYHVFMEHLMKLAVAS